MRSLVSAARFFPVFFFLKPLKLASTVKKVSFSTQLSPVLTHLHQNAETKSPWCDSVIHGVRCRAHAPQRSKYPLSHLTCCLGHVMNFSASRWRGSAPLTMEMAQTCQEPKRLRCLFLRFFFFHWGVFGLLASLSRSAFFSRPHGGAAWRWSRRHQHRPIQLRRRTRVCFQTPSR